MKKGLLIGPLLSLTHRSTLAKGRHECNSGATISPLLTYLLSILGLVIVAVYAIFRLNSTRIIREKVWSAFVGDKVFNDEKLKSFAHDQPLNWPL